MHATSRHSVRRRGVSLIEAIIALAISAILLTATMVATDASFKSYANAAQQASTQSGSRMVMYRLLSIFRNSRGAFEPLAGTSPWEVNSTWVEFDDAQGRPVRVEWVQDDQTLVYVENPDSVDETQSVLLGGVTSAQFTLRSRRSDEGPLVLVRITIDMTVRADDDATLQIEQWDLPEVRLIASTMPRRLF